MKNVDNRKKELRKKEVLDFASKLNSFLYAKKEKEILESEILRNNKEIEYICNRIERVQKQLDEKKVAISVIEPRIAELRDRLESVQSEEQTLENEYNRMLKIQKDSEKMQAHIQENRLKIAHLAEDIGKASEKFQGLKN